MIVRVRGVEIVCESLDELDKIIQRYGGEAAGLGAGPKPMARLHNARDEDGRLLRAFVRSPSGLPSSTLQGMLNVQGKAIPYALNDWAKRTRLPSDACVKTTIRGKRGWKLSEPGFVAARVLLEET